MKTNIIALITFISFVFGCQNSHSTTEVVTTSVTTTATTDSTVTQSLTTDEDLGVDSDLEAKESDVNSVTYSVDSWKVSAPPAWVSNESPLDQVRVFLTNNNEQLIFSVLAEEVRGETQQQYVDSQVALLKKLGLSDTTTRPVTVNGFQYMLIESPKSNFNNWQWVRFENKTAYVWSCGGPRGKKVNFESCMTVMTTVRK